MPANTNAAAPATAPGPPTTGQLNVLNRLSVEEPITATELATAAGMGRSTVTKALGALERAGLAHRQRGTRDGSHSEPDRWFATGTSVDPSPADEATPENSSGPSSDPSSAGPDPAAGQPPTDETTPSEDTVAKAEAPPAREAAEPAARLGKGALRAMVEQHLRAHPDRSWTPSAIAKAISRSAGAVSNACEKLLLDGAMEGGLQTWEDKPRRYQYTELKQK